MLFLKYVMFLAGLGVFVMAAAIVLYDAYFVVDFRRRVEGDVSTPYASNPLLLQTSRRSPVPHPISRTLPTFLPVNFNTFEASFFKR